MQCFKCDFLRVFNENVKIWLFGFQLGTLKFPIFLRFKIKVLSRSASREATHTFTFW